MHHVVAALHCRALGQTLPPRSGLQDQLCAVQWGVIYIVIIIVGYIIKDRLKEWGKRYLQPVAEWFGLSFPDRIMRVAITPKP